MGNPLAQFSVLTAEQLQSCLLQTDNGKPMLIDLRPVEEHLRARLRGTTCAPFRPRSKYAKRLLAQLPQPRLADVAPNWIIIGSGLEMSQQAAAELALEGVNILGVAEVDEESWRAVGLDVLCLEEIGAIELADLWLSEHSPGTTKIPSQAVEVGHRGKPAVQPIDVREPHEWRQGVIPGAKLLPLSELAAGLSTLDPQVPYAMVCRSGSRSRNATYLLQEQSFQHVVNLKGGMLSWQRAGLPLERGGN